MLDVSYGGDGPPFPLPLTPDLVTRSSIGTQELRLVHTASIPPDQQPPSSTKPENRQKLWVYQYRNSDAAEWNSCVSHLFHTISV